VSPSLTAANADDTDNGADGIGVWLPIFLAAVLLGAVAFLLIRRQGNRGPSGGDAPTAP
jgi:hypothetical protein